jgi:DNA polymerase I-like protein with 3'-5' exonuclease and polymerase domains
MKYWQSRIVCPDTETTGLDWQKDRVFGVALAWLDEHDRICSDYFDVRKSPTKYQQLRDKAPQFKKVVNHHMKFDVHMLLNDRVKIDPAVCECTMIRAALINEHLFKYDLDSLALKYLNKRKDVEIYQKLADIFGGKATKGSQMRNLPNAPIELVAHYAKVDAELALELYLWQEDEIERRELHQVCELERRLFPYVVRMERGGIRVDLDETERRRELLTITIDRHQKKINKLAGFEVNPNPSNSIKELFKPKMHKDGYWVTECGTVLESTGAGAPSIDKEALERIRHPAASLILSVRKLIRMRDTFLGKHVLEHARDGRVHPNINQTKGDDTGGTGTGRLSYTDPALQQIPSRDKEMAKIIRPVFLPDESMGWAYGDLDQHELRIFHHFVNNPKIVESYRADPDLDGHAAVAKLTGLPRNPQPGGKSTANAKQMNLAMIFNMGGGELAANMGLPFTIESFKKGARGEEEEHQYKKAGPEAQKIIDDYYAMMPGVKEIAQKARSIAKSRGYVKTLKGRHIRFPGGMFCYKASGLVYQGSAADLNKENMIRICEYLDSECPDGRLLLNIHDEYSLSLPFGGAKGHLAAIKAEIQRRPELRVPIRIDFSEPSSNWWDATVAEKMT